jgi:ABC-2 type transport system ATP-binding protein
MKTRLELAAVTKAFGRRRVLNQAWLQVRAGEAVGLIGANGAGKTTLLRIAAGLVRPDGGSVRWSGRPEMTGDDEARIRYYGGEMTLPPSVPASRWASLFNVRIDDRRPIGRLSRGGRQMLGLRVLLSGDEADLLLLDEPWEGLDPEGSAWLTDTVRRWRSGGAALLISSHRLYDLGSVCTRFLLLDNGRCHAVANRELRPGVDQFAQAVRWPAHRGGA